MQILNLALALVAMQAVHDSPTSSTEVSAGDPVTGRWHAWLDSPGGPIPFGLELSRTGICWEAWILNGSERLRVGKVEHEQGQLSLQLDPYDSRVRARIGADGRTLTGEWERYRGPDTWTRMPFHANAGAAPRFSLVEAGHSVGGEVSDITGRWRVDFESSEDPAVAVFDSFGMGENLESDQGVEGTFLTTLGDYRFLEGSFDSGTLSLSCFDGAHAFLFKAKLTPEGNLEGDFWSRDTWHESWTAVRDPEATLPDPFELTTWTGQKSLRNVVFPDLDGSPRSLADPEFQGRARVLVLFGTWCPNCYDASTYLRELHHRFSGRGLSILGLAFEFGDTFERNARVVKEYAEHKKLDYPILVAGPSDKAEASRAFPLLDRVRAYPTFLFLDRNDEPKAIYTGFSGPATGPAHDRLREQFERTIHELLSGE